MTEPVLLMASVRQPIGRRNGLGEPEAEPVLVARTSTEVILILVDGEELRFDASELRHAVQDK